MARETDLDRLSHMVRLITQGRPLDVVSAELREKRERLFGGLGGASSCSRNTSGLMMATIMDEDGAAISTHGVELQ